MLSRLFTQCPCGSPDGDVTLLTFTHFSGRTLRLCFLGDWTNKHLPTASDIQVTAFSTVRFHAFDLLLFFFKAMVMWSSTSPLVEGRLFFFQNSILKSLMLQLDTKAQSFSLQLPCIYGSAFTAFSCPVRQSLDSLVIVPVFVSALVPECCSLHSTPAVM